MPDQHPKHALRRSDDAALVDNDGLVAIGSEPTSGVIASDYIEINSTISQPVVIDSAVLSDSAVEIDTAAETVAAATAQPIVEQPLLAHAVFAETETETITQVAIDPTISQSVLAEPNPELQTQFSALSQLEEPVMDTNIARVAKRSLLGPVLGTVAALGLVSGGVWAATRAEVVDPTVTVTDVVVDRVAAVPTVTETEVDKVVVDRSVVEVTPVVTDTVVVVETDVVDVPAPRVTETDVVVDQVVVDVVEAKPLPAPAPVVTHAPVVVESDVETVTVTG